MFRIMVFLFSALLLWWPSASTQGGDLVARGRAIYMNLCARCHGENGDREDYPGTKSLVSIGDDLSDEEIAERSGAFIGRKFEGQEAAAMVAFLKTLTPVDRVELIVERSSYGRDEELALHLRNRSSRDIFMQTFGDAGGGKAQLFCDGGEVILERLAGDEWFEIPPPRCSGTASVTKVPSGSSLQGMVDLKSLRSLEAGKYRLTVHYGTEREARSQAAQVEFSVIP